MKKISAVFAAIATVLLSVFALAPSAMAADYSATISSAANEDGTATITVTLDAATYNAGYQYVGVTVNSDDISNVTLAAQKTYGWWKADASTFTAKVKLTTLNCKDSTVEVLAAKNAQDAGAVEVGETTVHFPATCKVSEAAVSSNGSGNGAATVAETGANVMPYAVAVVLLAAAGAALFAVRKSAR
ncbi:hypothetical protein JS528_07225 [Bifidobacterium sp. MA2]|uniref:Uncharacterized protein n=1 Tax=Bifidobacterium santillanense TaxID=2809028 RepID=A0ABS5UQG6_9BIFI|nr:hypothetical protein [Bifidobacterium santillanense]MBT1173144.1 hypothetical protein [Bifidobacterium santillanense]